MTLYANILPTTANLHKNAAIVVGRPVDANAVVSAGVRTIAVPVAASASTIDFNLRIPTEARILPSSRIYNDVLATSTATLDIGFRAVNANITSSNTTLVDGIALSTGDGITAATSGKNFLTRAAGGKKVWEHLALASDPGGFVDVVGQIKDAATTATGYVVLDMYLAFN